MWILELVDEGVGDFLRARRSRITPGRVGLREDLKRRRVPGLRREEVAGLAGVSVDYYVRLEQGRTSGVSDAVLDAVARVLQLDHDERQHLHHLAHPPRHHTGDEDQGVGEVMRRLVTGLGHLPALVLTPAMSVVTSNASAVAVFGPGAVQAGNVLRYAFTDPEARTRTSNWTDVATAAVAALHVQLGRYSRDPDIAALVAELSTSSTDFLQMWSRHDAREKGSTFVEVMHPLVGALSFTNVWLSSPASPRQTLVAYTVEPGSPTEEKLAILLNGQAGTSDHG